MSIIESLLAANSRIEAVKQAEIARVYVRVSHERSAEKNISPETQRQRIEAYARARGYIIREWYQDLGISAFKNDDLRTEWIRLLEDSKRDPETTVIVVWRYDRFSRGYNAGAIQHELMRHGVRIESAEEGYYDPDSETGAIMMPLTWSLNRLFSIKLRNVVIPNMQTNFQTRDSETGWAYKNGGWSMFGYKKHRVKCGRNKRGDIHKVVWLLDDTEVGGKQLHEWARVMLLDWRLKERLGYDSIAARLTEANIPTPSGKASWSASTIQSLLGTWDRLFQYTGVAFWGREDCTDRNNRKTRDASEWTVVEDAHPAIITAEEAQEILAMAKGKQKPKSGRGGEESRFALSGGAIVCAHCGANYAGAKRKAGDYYVCGSHLYRRGAGCVEESWYIPREEIESLTLSKIVKRLDESDEVMRRRIDELNEIVREQWRAYSETAKDRKEAIKTIEAKLASYYDLVATTGSNDLIRERIKECNASLNRLKRLEGAEKPAEIDINRLLELKAYVFQAQTDEVARRKVLKSFNVKITANAKTRELEASMDDPALASILLHGGPKGRRGECIPKRLEFRIQSLGRYQQLRERQ